MAQAASRSKNARSCSIYTATDLLFIRVTIRSYRLRKLFGGIKIDFFQRKIRVVFYSIIIIIVKIILESFVNESIKSSRSLFWITSIECCLYGKKCGVIAESKSKMRNFFRFERNKFDEKRKIGNFRVDRKMWNNIFFI